MEDLAPDDIARPDIAIKQNKVVPEQPGDVTEGKGGEKVLMHGNSTTGEGMEDFEDAEGDDEREERDSKARKRHNVDNTVEVETIIVYTVCVVGPGSV